MRCICWMSLSTVFNVCHYHETISSRGVGSCAHPTTKCPACARYLAPCMHTLSTWMSGAALTYSSNGISCRLSVSTFLFFIHLCPSWGVNMDPYVPFMILLLHICGSRPSIIDSTWLTKRHTPPRQAKERLYLESSGPTCPGCQQAHMCPAFPRPTTGSE